MKRLARRVALVVAGVGVVAGAAVGVAQAAVPGPSGGPPAAANVLSGGDLQHDHGQHDKGQGCNPILCGP